MLENARTRTRSSGRKVSLPRISIKFNEPCYLQVSVNTFFAQRRLYSLANAFSRENANIYLHSLLYSRYKSRGDFFAPTPQFRNRFH